MSAESVQNRLKSTAKRAYFVYQAVMRRPEAWEQLSERERHAFRELCDVVQDEPVCDVCGHALWCTICTPESCGFCAGDLKCPTCAIATALDVVEDKRAPRGIRRVK